MVDVDLSRPGTDPDGDRALADLIRGYPAGAPDLILVRSARPAAPGETAPLAWRRTWFDDAHLSAAVHFAHPRYTKDLVDLRLRRWRLVERGCLDGRPLALPSVPLLADVLLRAGREGWERLDARLAAHGPLDCPAAGRGHYGGAAPLSYAGRSIDPDAHGVEQRVIYAYSNRLRPGVAPRGLERVSAGALIGHLPGASADPVRGRVVVIGASYADSRDLHETPVGTLPGALVMLAAIKSLNQFGPLRGPETRVVLGIEAALIVLMAWLFARFDSWWAAMPTGILVLVPLSFWWFRYGVWVDLAAPILGMQLHQAYANREASRGHGAQSGGAAPGG